MLLIIVILAAAVAFSFWVHSAAEKARAESAHGGEPALIDALAENTQIALWRIAQETSTNTVRHANAKVFEMRLRVGIRGGRVWALLDLRDDGVGIGAGESQRQRGGLQSIRDRVLALDGAMKVQRRGNITRLHLLLRQAL